MLSISNLYKSFGKNPVLKGVNLEVEQGEVVVIVGPSGGGKTTLLRTINCLEKCDEGTIRINGETLCQDGRYVAKKKLGQIRQNIGLVFQNFNLFPHLSVLENMIEAPIRVQGKDKETAIKESLEILGFLGLSDKKDSYPFELSGGQKQRVAIGRALALSPQLMCFDEPTSALDPALTDEVAKVIDSLSAQGMTMLIITHDMAFAKKVAHRIISIDQGVILDDHIYASA
ncbi:MAG: amino acid ABC transporter ATP-binding protein [Cellulosilyticaceae bacterium]